MANVYEIITQQIISQLEKGTIPWRKPKTLPAANFISRKEYRGINAVLLNSLPFECPYFLTFKQARLLNGFVRHGEHGFPVVYWTFITDEETEKKIPLLRFYKVFNLAAQCVGIDAPKTDLRQIDSIAACEAIVSGMANPPKVSYGGNQAFYVPKTDSITLPFRQRFESAEEFYATLNHELVHATGHEKRLNRKGISESVAFGSQTYSVEELIAEIGTSFLNAKAGISSATLENSASYIANWLRVLRNDKRMVISAACQAQKAADYILGIQPSNE